MNLIIDIGNTRAKLAVFQNNEIIKTEVCYKEELVLLKKNIQKNIPGINHGILANVAKPQSGFKGALLGLKGKTIKLSHKTPLPFSNKYETPETLGLDRMAIAAAAVSEFSGKNILVIDAGTSITYDLITSNKEYLGGGISPGLNMRYRAMNNFTANLPLLRANNEELPAIGQNTIQGMRLGVKQGLTYELNGFIDRYKGQFNNLTVILTGGDCDILSKSLKNSIFVAKNFLLTGLNSILEHNKH